MKNSYTKFQPKRWLLTLLATSSLFAAIAGEGMWMPTDLKRKEAAMKEMGLQIPVDKIYNNNGTGLNEAVVWFDKGCSGEIISKQGLVLTNHHCGYRTVQKISGPGKDYFANGYWAMNNSEELPCPGLTVSIVKDIKEVTYRVLDGIDDTWHNEKRDSMIKQNIAKLEQDFKKAGFKEVLIRPYFQGNQYWAQIMQTFNDVRLVGFPPNGIGSFGGDTDNWMWPRHTGDFSVFRIYANENNEPADYSPSNKPYQSTQSFTINASGIKEGDFTMVYGFPGSTNEYISSFQLQQIYGIIDPIRIDTRTIKLDVWKAHMNEDRNVFLKYTSKKASVANGWKKWQGEVRGLKLNDVVNKKRAYERNFRLLAQNTKGNNYSTVLETIQANSTTVDDIIKVDEYIKEALYGIEIIAQANGMLSVLDKMGSNPSQELLDKTKKALASSFDNFYKNYDVATDKALFNALMPHYISNNAEYIPNAIKNALQKHNNQINNWSSQLYSNSILTNENELKNILTNGTIADLLSLKNDDAFKIAQSIKSMRAERITPLLNKYEQNIAKLNREYMAAQLALDKQKDFYPDANSTLRVTFGQVKGIDPDGPAEYSYQTYLSEAVKKFNPEVEEFNMPAKLIKLYNDKNFGRWGNKTDMPIAFIAQNHTTGGNSGSPVLNAKGQLIGTNFDRIWEGTMSDLYYDPKLCRNISVDIRYTLFIIEKFGGAGWLLKEMNIVQ